MYTLSRREEQILLAIWELKEEAYLVAIKKYLSDIMNKNWTVGAIHKPLKRLENTGMVESHMGEATPKRGGRSKKIYSITQQGLIVLTEYKRVNQALWSNFPDYKFG